MGTVRAETRQWGEWRAEAAQAFGLRRRAGDHTADTGGGGGALWTAWLVWRRSPNVKKTELGRGVGLLLTRPPCVPETPCFAEAEQSTGQACGLLTCGPV